MLFDYFYLVLVYITLSYQGQAICNKFLYFSLGIRHGSLRVVGLCVVGFNFFFFHEDIWTLWKFRAAAELPN